MSPYRVNDFITDLQLDESHHRDAYKLSGDPADYQRMAHTANAVEALISFRRNMLEFPSK